MKKGFSFIENEHLFNFVLSTMYFNEAKKEKEIFVMWRKGYNNCDIAKEVGYTEGTIYDTFDSRNMEAQRIWLVK